MELRDALESSFREFDRRLDTVEPTQWTLDTPCEGWTVRELVDHVWFGCMAYLRFFEGSSYRQVVAGRPPTLAPAVAAEKYRTDAAALVTLLRAPGSLEREVRYPTREHTTGADLLVFRMWDNLMHAWDLAQALHIDDHLDDEVVALSYELILPHLDMYRDTGHLADPQPLRSGNATTQARLLRLSGRTG